MSGDSLAIELESVAERADLIPTIARWYWIEWGQAAGRSLESETARLMGRANRDRIPMTWLALEKDQPVGSVMLVQHDMPDQSDLANLAPWLAGLYVLPTHRGLGVGGTLTCRCEAEARRLGNSRLFLYTWTARALYKRLGWTDYSEREHRGRLVTIMSKSLG